MTMFWRREKKLIPHGSPRPGALLDPSSRLAVDETDAPGYYPGYSVMDQQKFWDAATRKLIQERIAETPEIRFFTQAEAATMQAVVSRVVPQDDRTEDSRIPILAGLDERLYLNRIEGFRYVDMPSDQEAYRIAASAIGEMGHELHQKAFSELKTLHQEEILQSLHDATPIAAKEAWMKLNVKRFWTMLVSDCCAVYYAHPRAWDEIGFGGPAYPRGYMRLEGGEAEPWEVDEQRYEWLAPDDTLSDRPQTTAENESSHHGQSGTH